MLFSSAGATDAVEPKAPRQRLRIVTLEGSPYDRGRTHGQTLADSIQELLKLWKADLAARYKMDAAAFIKKFVQQTDYLPAMRKWTPDLLDEVRGIAQGAGVDFDTMLVFQLVDEYWVNGPGIAGEHCSALGFSSGKGRPSYIAQTMDLEGFRNGFQTVLHIKQPDSKREAFVLTCAGLIGLNGVNNRSVGICCNTLSQLAHCRDGLPVACIVRGLLQSDTEAAAVAFLRRVKHASGQNYLIGGPSKVSAYECSAGKVAQFEPAAANGVVWHTNHPLVNDDYNPAYRRFLEKTKDTKKEPDSSTTRLDSLQRRLGKEGTPPSLELIQQTLAARDSAQFPVCRPYHNARDNFTFAATIMVLSEKPELHVTAGPPDAHPYQSLRFTSRP